MILAILAPKLPSMFPTSAQLQSSPSQLSFRSPLLPCFALWLPISVTVSNVTSGYFLNTEYFSCCFSFRSTALWYTIQLLLKSLWSLSSTFLCQQIQLLLLHLLYSVKKLIALLTFILREDAKPNSFHKFILMCIITHISQLSSSSNKWHLVQCMINGEKFSNCKLYKLNCSPYALLSGHFHINGLDCF